MSKFVLGIDVGGTNVKLGLVNRQGKIIARSSLNTKSFIRTPKDLIDAIVEQSRGLIALNRLTKKDVIGIGIGLPGLIDPVKGIVKFLPNIPNWHHVPLEKILVQKLHIPVFIENDVNLIALGEWKYGAGVGEKNMICITLGTGVGGGLILNNGLYRGSGYCAGEIGHVPLNEQGPRCNCGGRACFERYVGNRYLLERARRRMGRQDLTLEELYLLAQKGNRQALKFWDEIARQIGIGLTGMVNLLNPSRIVIGGGVANSYQFLHRTIAATIRARAMKVQGAMVRITRSRLGSDAGIVGAQVLVRQAFQKSS